MNHRLPLPCATSLALIALLVISCSDAPTAPEEPSSAISQHELALRQEPPVEATVQFGRPEVGADFPPEEEHPSSHAKDALQPRTVVIAAGGSVTFDMALLHQVAIYEPGTRPEDIDTSELTGAPTVPFPFPPLIDDEDGRVAVGPLSFPAPIQWSYTFEEPGRYLVICAVLPHFAEFDMYGWVIVK